MIEESREHLGWVLHECGPDDADHSVLMLPGALCTARFYDDVLAEPTINSAPIRFVATTLPGFGGTAPLDDVTVEDYAKAASRLAAELLCGVGFGILAAAGALRHVEPAIHVVDVRPPTSAAPVLPVV